MESIFIQFKTREISALDSYMLMHKFQFDLKNYFPTVRFYDYNKEQFEIMVHQTYNKCNDPLTKMLIDNLINSFDPDKHVYGEIFFDVRCLGYYKERQEELFLIQNERYPWSFPIGIFIDKPMFSDMFRVIKTPATIEMEEGATDVRIMEVESIHQLQPEWDSYTGVLKNIYIQEKYLTDVDIAYKPRCKLETYTHSAFQDVKGVPVHRINKNVIYDVRQVNLTTDRYDKAIKLNAEEATELQERVEEFKEIKMWKDLPQTSSSAYVGQDQNFFGVDIHVTGDARARVTIADKQVSLKYWNKESIAALYVDAAIRTHKNFIKDWERKLNFPNLKQIVVCVCPICLKGKKFPRRSSQFPDHLIYTQEYKDIYKPEDL